MLKPGEFGRGRHGQRKLRAKSSWDAPPGGHLLGRCLLCRGLLLRDMCLDRRLGRFDSALVDQERAAVLRACDPSRRSTESRPSLAGLWICILRSALAGSLRGRSLLTDNGLLDC